MAPLWRVVALCIAITGLIAGAVIAFLLWLFGISLGKLGGVDTIGDLRDVLTIGFGVVAAVGGVIDLVVAYRRQRVSEAGGELAVRTQAHTEYVQAVEQLGSDKAAVRLGGLYALDRLGGNHPEYRQTIVDVICAYLRMPYDPPAREQADTAQGDDGSPEDARQAEPAEGERPVDNHGSEARQELQVRLTAQRLLAGRLRWPAEAERPANHWAGMTVDLTDATLINVDFSHCRMSYPQFSGVQFSGHAGFSGAWFSGDAWFGGGVRFSGEAWFGGAQFSGFAWFGGAQFSNHAEFHEAQFSGDAAFVMAQFGWDARFGGARFTGNARFMGAQFTHKAEFREARFSGDADFGGTQFSGNAEFRKVQFNWNAGFREARFGGYADFEGGRVHGSARRFVLPQGWMVEPDRKHPGRGVLRKSSDEGWPLAGELKPDGGAEDRS